MANLVIIRGLPGSGKTTTAVRDYSDHVLCEADQYFYKDGKYEFDPKMLKHAHDYCYEKAKETLERGCNAVVANTFTRLWEFEKYLDLPFDSVTVKTATGRFNNVHGVPELVIKSMSERWEYYPEGTFDKFTLEK